MFYARINKLKVFDNREGFLGIFNRRAELKIYSYVVGAGLDGDNATPALTLSDLMDLPDEAARRQKLLDAALAEAGNLAQSRNMEINRVKDNQILMFGESGMAVYQSSAIPDRLDIQLWVIESDSDVRNFAVDADKIIESDAFKGLFAAVETALVAASPVISGVIALGGVVVNVLRKKLLANKDDLVGYWYSSLNRVEHYPHGVRDKQDVYDTTGNILLDYTLFGFENEVVKL